MWTNKVIDWYLPPGVSRATVVSEYSFYYVDLHERDFLAVTAFADPEDVKIMEKEGRIV